MVAGRVDTVTSRSNTLTTARRLNTGSYTLVRLSKSAVTGLKIRCPKGRAGSDLKNRDGNGLAGVNVNSGRTERELRLSDLDERFVTDEALGLMSAASGNRLIGHRLN